MQVAEFITANTFGANSLKYDNVDELVKAGVALAKKRRQVCCARYRSNR